jgi:hypothetical protein
MTRMTIAPETMATLEISDRRLPARMVAGRLRADLPRQAPLPAMAARRVTRLAMLLARLGVPVASATRHRPA